MKIAKPYRYFQDIMDMAYNSFRDGLNEPENRTSEIMPEFYQRMRRANIELEKSMNIIPKELEQIFEKINKYTINHKTQDIASTITPQEINS